jgi:hypothetical protein
MTRIPETISWMLAAALVAMSVATHAHAQMPQPMSLPEARQFFVCKTHLSFDPGHGTQVSYLRPDGASFLWYPGNSIVLKSGWKLEERVTARPTPSTFAALCYQHGENTYNPVTKQRGGLWECLPAHVWASVRVERADGDVFGLATRSAVPFRLSREQTTIAALQQKVPAQARKQNAKQPKAATDRDCAANVALLAAGEDAK